MEKKINKNIKKEVLNVTLTIIASMLSAFGLYVFVYPSKFAPSGVDGIATMLQEITSISAGYFSLLINLPLLVIAFFVLKKKYVIYTIIITVVSSLMIIVLEGVNFYQYKEENDRILSAIFSGLILGVRTGIMLKIGASSGGIDIIASIFHKKRPYVNVEKIISIICYVIIAISFFVYDNDLNCILLSIVQMFVFEKAVSAVLRDSRDAIEIKIITKNPEEIKQEIISNLKHGATIIDSKGMFTGEPSSMIVTIINTRQVGEFLNIIKRYPNTFVYYSNVVGVKGNFRWFKDDEVK